MPRSDARERREYELLVPVVVIVLGCPTAKDEDDGENDS
jgi:hypothetical protein